MSGIRCLPICAQPALPTRPRPQSLAPESGPRVWPQSLAEVYATLPGEGVYLCRVRTMYLDPCRPWRGCGTPQAASPPRSGKSPNCWPKGPTRCGPGSEARPGIARIKLSGGQFEAPNTKLMRPVKWSSCSLYVILDIDRRRPPGPCIPQNSPPDCFVRASPDRSARVGWRSEHAESAIQFKAPRRRHWA